VQLTTGDLRVDLLARKVYRRGEQIELQPREFALLEYLVRNKSAVVTRAQILHHVWGYDFTPSTNVVEVHVCRLREKLEKPGQARLIRTMRGAGYMFADAEDENPVL
jgi:two-component system OmpR family response regulator